MAVTFRGAIQTVAVLGNDQVAQNLFVLQNGIGSRVDVNVRRLVMQTDMVAALNSVMPIVKTSRATAISGGALVGKDAARFNSTQVSDPLVYALVTVNEIYPIVATPGNTVWQQGGDRMHTGAEQQLSDDANLLPQLVEHAASPFVLHPGEALLVRVTGATVASNAMNARNWMVQCVWEEESIPTFAISGTVTLSAAPVEGARVLVMEADDNLMTNARLHEVVITDVSGNWASSIATGKVAAVFVQYTNGGLYYTAPGSPYLS